ncbi:MAG: hypothetical protein HY755_08445 [Nitrospirae bacterium]|nr:hypothetical protein [Nitrospirota bacterium]
MADADNVVAEIYENNNTTFKSVTIGSDLSVSSLTVPNTAGAGKSISISDTTKNNGPSDAGASTTSFYLSTNVVLDAGDTYLGSRAVPALAAGATSSGSTTVTIPAGTSGTYYIIAMADSGNVVAEIYEYNNTTYTNITIGSDLVVSSLTVPSTAGAGKSISISDTTKNNGAGDAGASTTKFYFSTDTVLDAGDTLLGSRAVPALAADATSSGSTTVTIPSGTSGTYYIIAMADADNAVAEINENNNTYIKTISIELDFVISALTVPSTTGAGKSISISDTTKNNGPSDAAASTTKFYLSTDTVFDVGDTLLGSRAVPALAANATSLGSTTVTIPAGTPTGSYFIIAKADADNVIVEVNETNNTLYRAISIGPDLTISSISAPSSAIAGNSISLSDTTKNNGAGDAGASTTKFYLSKDTVVDGSDSYLGSRAVPALAAGASDSASTTVTIPTGTAKGNYYIVAVADADNAVAEVLETNNTRASRLITIK